MFDCYEKLRGYSLWHIKVKVKIWKLQSLEGKIVKDWSEGCLGTNATRITKFENMDLF